MNKFLFIIIYYFFLTSCQNVQNVENTKKKSLNKEFSISIEPNLKITGIKLLVKSGGKKGLWINPNGIPEKIKSALNI